MNKKEDFVMYEYKNINIKKESVSIYVDCISNFGWILIDEHEKSYQTDIKNVNTYNKSNDLEMITLKFKRNVAIKNKQEINTLEHKCEEALETINKLENKKNSYTMGISLGIGIFGTIFLGLAVYNYTISNIIVGIFFTAIGFMGWAVGYLANGKLNKNKSIEVEPKIQQQLTIAYNTCEKAHGLLI